MFVRPEEVKKKNHDKIVWWQLLNWNWLDFHFHQIFSTRKFLFDFPRVYSCLFQAQKIDRRKLTLNSVNRNWNNNCLNRYRAGKFLLRNLFVSNWHSFLQFTRLWQINLHWKHSKFLTTSGSENVQFSAKWTHVFHHVYTNSVIKSSHKFHRHIVIANQMHQHKQMLMTNSYSIVGNTGK